MLVPKPNSRPVLPLNWQGLTDLRVSLVSQGRFMEALRFSSTERSAATGIEDYQTACLLLQLSKNYYAQVVNTKDEIPWRIAILGFKIDLGKLFAFLGAKEQAAMWLNNLEKELEDCISLINGSVGTLRASDSLNVLTMEFYRLKMVAKEEPTKARFQQLHSLGQKMQASSHIEAEYSHYLAIEWAEKLFSQEEFEVIRIDIQIRTQKLFEAQGRVSAEATNISDILSTSKLNSAPELARRIELLNEFERRHPGITLPTVKRLVFLMRFRLQTQVGLVGHQDLEAAANSLSRFGNIPSGFDLRRHVSSLDLTEQDLEVKDILDKRDVQDREFSLDYNFSIQREEVAAPILLNKLVSEEAASGVLVESALVQLFGSGEDNTCLKKDTILTLDGKELLKNLVGTSEFPLRAVEWTKRRPILQSWLLDESRKDYRLRQRLWIAIHNSRSAAWGSHYLLNHKRKDFIKTQAPRLIKADCVGEFVKTTSPVWFEVCCEQINAVEERLKLKELKLESDHYEREWWIARSILPQLYTNLFLCCFVPGEEFTEVMIHFFSHAEKIARDQLTHWRSVDNSEYFAQAAIHLANIAQLRIEYGIIKDPDDVGRTVEDTLEVLEEVELLFGTTLYEIDLDQSLDVLNMKSLMGSGIGIWTIGRFAVRLLHLAITGEGNGVPHTDIEKLTGRRIHWLDQLWQWVQRVKARTIAQTMGLDNMVPESMLIEIQRSTHDERASAEKMSTPTRPLNLATPSEDMDIGKRITALKLEEESEPHLEILSEVREILKDSRKVVPDIVVTTIGVSASQDLQRFSVILDKLERPDTAQIEEKGKLEAELLQISQRTNKKPALHRLVAIAQFLNREEVLRNRIAATADRFQHRIELQRLRQEMRKEPILEKMLKIREGRPVSNQDLQKIAATRNGKVVFVD
jgi:hypothetical protein